MWRGLCVLLVLILAQALPRAARAQESELPASEHEPLAVEVVLVGVSEDSDQLARVIADLLRVRHIRARFERRAELTEHDLTAHRGAHEPTVWILYPQLATVRLVFGDDARKLFIVRDIPLPQGLDELGRESVGQIVESSLLALLHGVSGASRAAAQAALLAYLPKPATTRAKPAPVAGAPEPPARAPTRRLSQRLGASYQAAWSGGAFGLEQGPGVFSGVELAGVRDTLFVLGAVESCLDQHYGSAEFDLTIQSNRGWLLFGWRRSVGARTSLVASGGPGIDVTRVTSKSNTPKATAAAGAFAWSPWLRTRAGIEWGGSPVAVELALVADLALYRTHFDVVDDTGTHQVLARPSVLRPGLALSVVWR
ncbi:MAG TPA: hypothetical protein VGM29_03925 [Polyangiaceae bacterium]|jgi:hypothetical protein